MAMRAAHKEGCVCTACVSRRGGPRPNASVRLGLYLTAQTVNDLEFLTTRFDSTKSAILQWAIRDLAERERKIVKRRKVGEAPSETP